MRKKKPPVVLASTLIVLVGLAVVLYPKNEDPNQPPPPPAATEEKTVPTGQSRSTPDPKQLASQLNSTKTKPPMGRQEVDENGPTGNPATATIFIPRYNPTQQTPNDASVQAQWYRGNARANRKEGFK